MQLPLELRSELVARARDARPLEACGLLLGSRSAHQVRVCALREGRNLCASPTRFELDPADHVRIQGEARAAGLEVVGVWHSHPLGDARPSPLDRSGAWPGWSYLIVGLGAPVGGELRSWRLQGGDWVEEGLVQGAVCSQGGTAVTES